MRKSLKTWFSDSWFARCSQLSQIDGESWLSDPTRKRPKYTPKNGWLIDQRPVNRATLIFDRARKAK